MIWKKITKYRKTRIFQQTRYTCQDFQVFIATGFTARIQKIGEGTVLSLFVSLHPKGHPHLLTGGPQLPRGRGYPLSPDEWYPYLLMGLWYPHLLIKVSLFLYGGDDNPISRMVEVPSPFPPSPPGSRSVIVTTWEYILHVQV